MLTPRCWNGYVYVMSVSSAFAWRSATPSVAFSSFRMRPSTLVSASMRAELLFLGADDVDDRRAGPASREAPALVASPDTGGGGGREAGFAGRGHRTAALAAVSAAAVAAAASRLRPRRLLQPLRPRRVGAAPGALRRGGAVSGGDDAVLEAASVRVERASAAANFAAEGAALVDLLDARGPFQHLHGFI